MGKFDDYGIIKVPVEVLSKMSACPIDSSFKILGQKFMILILRDLILFGKKRFSNLLESVEGINQKTLSIRLKELENGGIIKRKIYSQNPIRAEYLITKKGRMLRPVLEQMAAFSLSYCSDSVFEDKKPRPFKEIVGRSPSSL
jgi:DNA-binding HxlR family transcriptional regulator